MTLGSRTQEINWSPSEQFVRAKVGYTYVLITLTVVIALASFVRDREHLLTNISLWLFAVPFALTLFSTRVGLLTALLLLTISPALHLQLNAALDFHLHAFGYPGVDCCLGFLTAFLFKGQVSLLMPVLLRSGSAFLLLFHAWIAVSAAVSIARNIWQSGSEFSTRGLFFNTYLVRGLTWHDDYFPLQDLFVYGAAIVMLLSVWALTRKGGQPLVRQLALVLFVGFGLNAAFAIWQKTSGGGWISEGNDSSVNAFWPDLHSLGALMVLSLLLGYGYLKTQPTSIRTRTFVASVILLSAIALYFSGSRFTIFILCIVVACWVLRMALLFKGKRRIASLIALATLIAAVDWTLRRGYRGVSYDSLQVPADGLTFAAIDRLLSLRPGIWEAALRMYSEFPLFGLGQGSFYKLSAIPEFSRNSFLSGAGGENAHNYFLQTFVELGPIGAMLIFLCCFPILRQGRNNFNLISFYALFAILLANLFAHALLVREMLMLLSVFFATYYWQSDSSEFLMQPTRAQPRFQVIAWIGAALVALAAVEVAQSFNRFPFNYGQRCFMPRTLSQDGWTSGLLRQPIPDSTALIQLALSANRPDVQRRPLAVEIAIVDSKGKGLWSRTLKIEDYSDIPVRFAIEVPHGPQTGSHLSVRTSHCYVPLNLGVAYDRRALGVRIDEMRFVSNEERPQTR